MSSFKRNLLIGYGISMMLLLVSAVASFLSIKNLMYHGDLVNHTNGVIRQLDAIALGVRDGEAGQRGYLLTGDARFLAPQRGAYQETLNAFLRMQEMTTDNPEQQQDGVKLKELINQRFGILQYVIDKKSRFNIITTQDLDSGRRVMEQLTTLLNTMETREKKLLNDRSAEVERYSGATPILIVVASLLALAVTVISFMQVNADYARREKLQGELVQKDKEISQRLTIIQGIADKISSGDYKTRVSDEGKDVLGTLAGSLNKMAESLEFSFTALSEKEWQQTGIAGLNEKMLGEKDIESLTYKITDFLTTYTHANVGVFYLVKNPQTLAVAASIGIDSKRIPQEVIKGEGLVGQSALSGQVLTIDDIPAPGILVNYTLGDVKPRSVIAIPVYFETILKGVVVIGSLELFTKAVTEFLRSASYNIGMAIHSARDHQRLQELLTETQAQSEELQAQHSELENINAELEAQSEKLQASEEELRVQQEELQQSNQELEERSRLLEEKNELILERNIEIQNKAEELALSTRYKSEFLANMSHELRTPLNSILLLSRLLTENHEGNLSEEQIEYAKVITSSGNGLLTLIDEILDLSKIESGKMRLDYADVRLSEVVSALEAMFTPLAKEKQLAFSISVDPALPQLVETDRLRLEQIVRNLISNAIKFTAEGSVKTAFERQGDLMRIVVKDTGIGIAKDKQQTIFEAFQQADGSTRRKYGGTGLGLSISRELAKLLGGEIQLKSEPGKGSEFTLFIPLKKTTAAYQPESISRPVVAPVEVMPAEEPARVATTPDRQYTAAVIPSAIPDDRDKISKGDRVILIIEDDTAFAKSLLDYTRKKGYKGVVAVRGDEGVELARQLKPLGILLDIQLPVKNGWEVMEELKSNPATRPIPVHIMSSHDVKNKSLSRGAIDFISKPMAFEKVSDVFQKIEHALSRHPKKVLIVEENKKHAQALAYFLEGFDINTEIKNDLGEGMKALSRSEIDCVILDMGVPAVKSYEMLEEVKKSPGFENLPIIIFTGKNLSHIEELRIKQYADSIVIKTAHSYKRIIDEVSLFLHLVEENTRNDRPHRYKKMGAPEEVLKGKTVLIADDDVRNIFSLTKSLESFGMNIISAVDGKDALKQLNDAQKVDIVLMDMMMPEMDGYESTRFIRQIPKFRNLPVIAVTAKAMTGDREKCIDAGCSDYITKPVDVDQLVSLLRVWLYE